MNSWPALDRFLQADPRDAGCDQAMELLYIYAEIAVADPHGAEQRHVPAGRPVRRRLRPPLTDETVPPGDFAGPPHR
jgi:hypothetical protein